MTFQQMIAMADRKGIVDMTIEALFRRTTIPIDILAKGIRALEQPDPDSRNPAEGGRRILRLNDHREWGWQIVNYEVYRQIRSADERRNYMTSYQRDRRTSLAKEADGKEVVRLPLMDGSDFIVTDVLVEELGTIYPAVDVTATVKEMKGWLIGNPTRRKMKKGIRRFIVSWLQREQEKHGGKA